MEETVHMPYLKTVWWF